METYRLTSESPLDISAIELDFNQFELDETGSGPETMSGPKEEPGEPVTTTAPARGLKLTGGRIIITPCGLTYVALDGTDSGLWSSSGMMPDPRQKTIGPPPTSKSGCTGGRSGLYKNPSLKQSKQGGDQPLPNRLEAYRRDRKMPPM